MTVLSPCPHGMHRDSCMFCFNPEVNLPMIGIKQYAEQAGQQQSTARVVRPDETAEEKAARLRQERFEYNRVIAAPEYMPEAQYRHEYMGRTWFMTRDVMQQAEVVLRICHCWRCEEFDEARARIVATRFFVRFEDDPMQNYPALAHLTCHRCGFDEYYPLRSDPRAVDRVNLSATEVQIRQQHAEMKLRDFKSKHVAIQQKMMAEIGHKMGIPSGMLADEADSMRRILEQEEVKRAYRNTLAGGLGKQGKI